MALASGRDAIWAVLAFTVFAVVDVFDGVAARRAGCDTAARRLGDVVIDRLAIHAAALTCCLVYETGWFLWILLLSRDVLQGGLSMRFVNRTRTVVIGAYWHMLYGLAMLVWGTAFIINGAPVVSLSVATLMVSVATFADYHLRCAALEKRFFPPRFAR